jgi:alanine racemase
MSNPHRTLAEVDLSIVRENLEALVAVAKQKYSRWAGAVAMVKCDAYGHGAVKVAQAMEHCEDTLAFGVATVDEGLALRRGGLRKPVWIFSDCATALDAFEREGFVAIVQTLDELKAVCARNIKFHLKFNTGMNRLGFAPGEARLVARHIARARSNPHSNFMGICTHLAQAEKPTVKSTRAQLEQFREVLKEFESVPYVHGAGTDAILAEAKLGLGKICNVIRPGIGLYGYSEMHARKLRPALVWKAQVVHARKLGRGSEVGYGSTYKSKDAAENQAVVGVGYGDGFKRILSNQVLEFIQGTRRVKAIVQGRVSMDLCSLNLRAKCGDWVTLLGEDARQGQLMSTAARTNIYEILTSIGPRVPRVYLNEAKSC